MIDKKLLDTLKSLGFNELRLKNGYISKESRKNELTLIDEDILVTYISYPPGENRGPHSHDEIRLTLVRSGIGILGFANEEIHLNPGDISILLSGVVHSLEVTGDMALNICEVVIDANGGK